MIAKPVARPCALAAAGLLLVAFVAHLTGQAPGTRATAQVAIPSPWVPGFAGGGAGEVIAYPSAYPGQLRTLLTRATDGKMRIEWNAQAVAAGPADELVHFVWHAGLASGYGAHRFTLSVNGTPCATFASGRDTNDREWSIETSCGGRLAFKTTKVGNFNELFGLMILSIPRRFVVSGTPRFAAVGEAAGSQDYYLVFMEPLADFVRVSAEQALLTGGRHALRVEVSRIADEQAARVVAAGTPIWSGTIPSGHTSLFVAAPVRAPTQLPVTVEVGGRRALATTVTLPRVRKWEIHLLPHSHVDIGYSDPQPEVERKQWKNLRDAVELSRTTATYPVESRFRWNVEGLWAVESYLRQANDAERLRFIDAVKAGSIGLQANYTNILTGLASAEELLHWTDGARALRQAYGFGPIRSAMHTDIPGLSWTSVQALAEGGVRYFSSGPNYMPSLPDGGDRIGNTLKALGDKPFWWVSPSGRERILFWVAGRGYSWFHGMNMGSITKAGRTPILDYVRELSGKGYPWDMVQTRYTIGGDNGPVDPQLPDAVKAWNETFDSPKLVINTAEAMFAEFERRYGAKLPEMTGDMTPYWEDGAVSSAREEAAVRAAARRLVQAETLWCLRQPGPFPRDQASEAWRQVLLWHEHTWGAADSVSQPDRADVVGQWTYKRQFALEAERQSRQLLDAAVSDARAGARAVMPTSAQPGSSQTIEVANTLSWPHTGVVLVDAKVSAGRDRVTDAGGRALVSQRLKDGRLAVLVTSVPPLASTRLTLQAGEPLRPAMPARAAGDTLDNGLVQVAVDPETGDIRSLRGRFTGGGRDLVIRKPQGSGSATALNRYLYVPGRDPSKAEWATGAQIAVEESGPLLATLAVRNSKAPGARSLLRRVTLAAGQQVVGLETVVDKAPVRTKESAHIGFPFDIPAATIRVDLGAALVVPERDQLPGSCRDFIGVHSAVDLSGQGAGVALASLDAPLIELGAMTDETQDPTARVRAWRPKTVPGSTVFAYLLNNYWHTNYKADQEGPLVFRFVLRPHGGDYGDVALRRFSAEQEQPLLAYPVNAAARPAGAPFRLEGTGVTVASIRSDGASGGLLVRVYNASARPATVRLVPSRGTRVTPPGTLTLAPRATRLVRVQPPLRDAR